jgi:streptomycin 6-kinase
VLKVTPSEDDEADHEGDALAVWDGHGAARLLRQDPRRRALLLSRAWPGTDLAALADDRATAIAVETALRLWRPAHAPFRWIGDVVPRRLDDAEEHGTTDRDLLRLARTLLGEVDPRRTTLVHGDFHHHNLLRTGAEYVAIDPKPLLGEPEFDAPTPLWSPLGARMRLEETERRVAAFAAAGLDEGRIRAWAVIRGAYLRTEPEETAVLRALLP